MVGKLADIVTVAPGFRASVNIRQELDDFNKAAAFLPTENAAEVFWDLARQLEPTAGQRARLITGMYGTGKSHLGLVLAALYRGHADKVEPVLQRLEERNAQAASRLRTALSTITEQHPFLLVLVDGDQDEFNSALIRALWQTLRAHGLDDFMPRTAFTAAKERLEALLDDEEAAHRVRQAVERLQTTVDELAGGLEVASLDAYRTFEAVHREVCFGASFEPVEGISAASAFVETAEHLVERGLFGGIVVIWDEFGTFMERMAQRPESTLAIQEFAEAANNSRENQLHVYLIAHRSLASYIRRARDAKYGDSSFQDTWEIQFKKIQARFKEFFQESRAEDLYQLIDDVVVQRAGNGWDEFEQAHDSEFSILAEQTYEAGFFESMSLRTLERVIVRGSYPLHPATAALLPLVAEIVAQNQRTMFTFLCADEPGTVADFLRTTPIPASDEPIPLVTADRLWDYFETAIREDTVGRRTYATFRAALAEVQDAKDKELTIRLLKVLALFELVHAGRGEQAYALTPTLQRIQLAMGARLEREMNDIQRRLDELSARGPGRVVLRTRDGTYRLIAGGQADLEEAIDRHSQDPSTRELGQYIRDVWGPSGDAEAGEGLGFLTEVSVPAGEGVVQRTVEVVPVAPEELSRLDHWLRDVGDGHYKDGILFVVLATAPEEVGQVGPVATANAHNLQVIFARPNQPLESLRGVVARLQALKAVAAEEPETWGSNGTRRDEWELQREDAWQHLGEALTPVKIAPGSNKLDMTCIWRGTPYPVRQLGDLEAILSEAMSTAFAKTPKTHDDMMLPPSGKRDGLRGHRCAIIDILISNKNPGIALAAESQAGRVRIIDLLESFGMFQRSPKPRLCQPDPSQHPAEAEIWKLIAELRDAARGEPQPLESLVHKLRSAPFGVGPRVIPLLLAAVLGPDIASGNLLLERRSHGNWQSQQPISGDELDKACSDPANYRIRFVEVSERQFYLVEGIILAIGAGHVLPVSRQELLGVAREEIAKWWHQLPEYCRRTETIGRQARRWRDEVFREVVAETADPYEILVEKLKDVQQHDSPDAYAEALRPVIEEIEQALEVLRQGLPKQIAEALALDVGEDATAEKLYQALRHWYLALPAETRQFRHTGDAGVLQRLLTRQYQETFLDDLCHQIMGQAIANWSDRDVQQFVGHLRSAKRHLEEWQPPLPPGQPPAPPAPGTARIDVVIGDGQDVKQYAYQFRYVPPEELSEKAKWLLRFFQPNLLEDPGLADGEMPNVLLQLLLRALGDDTGAHNS
ncbi:MAG: hypothetical protein H5T86_06910 [Armatimonadetes bacterium]|nr:hypothetical protein [Armatimonadota bacterium]